MILSIVSALLNAYCLLIVAWAILSWFMNANKTARDIYNALDVIVSPYVNLFRKFIPPMGGVDFSPLVALILLQLVARVLIGI